MRAHNKRQSKDPRHWLDKSASVCIFCLIPPTTGWKWPVWLAMNINVTHVRLRQFSLIWCVTSLAVKGLQMTEGGGRRWSTGWILVAEALSDSPENEIYMPPWLTSQESEALDGILTVLLHSEASLPPAGKISFIGPHAQALSSKEILVQMSGCANLQIKMCDLILIRTALIFFCYFEANSCLRDSFYRMFSTILKSQVPYWQRLSEPFL